ncbi:hypothetical protein [Alkalihalobacillus sp. TS-13]|uniref:hypothetical protein n=1 Tax=Alkalihalobacillus sp. TS-13 TaxID=2842455 RepID=UPI0021AA2329|nr:hypothetical protein [Alkalihalobacillus sp. TS-13]
MNYVEMITSPYNGVIEEVHIKENGRIYEWDSLFKIRTVEGIRETISVGLSGSVKSLEVSEGEEVVSGMVMAYIAEDLVVGGSD